MSDNRPVMKFRSYPINIAIWKNVNDETGRESFSISLTKEVQNKETGEYKKHSSFYPAEAAVASLLLAQAVGWISIQERSGSKAKEEIKESEAF